MKYTHIKILGMIFFHLWGISLRKFQIQKCLVHNNKRGVHWVCRREKCNSNWIFFLIHNFKKSFSNSWICNNPWAKWYFSYQIISLGLSIHWLRAQSFTSLKAQFFREINFTKFSWNEFHEKNEQFLWLVNEIILEIFSGN